MGKFPFHTDTAYWPVPARYVLFHCLAPGAGDRPTLIIDPRDWHLTDMDRRALCNEVWRTTTSQSFLCTIATRRADGLCIRFDDACVTPMTREAFRVRDLVRALIRDSTIIPIQWRAGDLLVIDNLRLLHARGEARVADPDRVLARILVRE